MERYAAFLIKSSISLYPWSVAIISASIASPQPSFSSSVESSAPAFPSLLASDIKDRTVDIFFSFQGILSSGAKRTCRTTAVKISRALFAKYSAVASCPAFCCPKKISAIISAQANAVFGLSGISQIGL